MADDYEERVRARAYRLWQEEGCPEGRADAHWELARELVAIEDNQRLATKPIGPAGSNNVLPEPVEFVVAVENQGEFPTLTDEGEGHPYPARENETSGTE